MSTSQSRILILIFAIITAAASAAIGSGMATQSRPRSESELEKEMRDKANKEANKKRQQDIRNDTDKLFQLATELKAAVDKSNENLLSLDVVRKADEVEKLAHRVKEKMKESVGPNPKMEPVPQPEPRLPR